jgi:hypothetical protein
LEFHSDFKVEASGHNLAHSELVLAKNKLQGVVEEVDGGPSLVLTSGSLTYISHLLHWL